MKLALLVLTAVVGASAFAQTLPGRKQCQVMLSIATTNATEAKNLYNSGAATKADVSFAQVTLFDTQLQCGEIVRGDVNVSGSYCSQANVASMDAYVKGTQNDVTFGQKTEAQAQTALLAQANMQAICAP